MFSILLNKIRQSAVTLSLVWQSAFARAALTLIGGTAVGQGIIVVTMPVLTRLYTPEEFRIASVYLSTTAIFASIACLRLEIAIPQPSSDTDAAQILALSLFFSCVSGIACAVILAVAPIPVSSPINLLGANKWLIPVGIWSASSFNALQYWATRFERFSEISRVRIMQSSTGVLAQMALGIAGSGPLGLMVGHALFAGAGSIRFLKGIVSADRFALSQLTMSRALRQLNVYKRYPQFSTLEAFTNSLGIQGPIIAIATLLADAEAGFVFLAMRVMNAPLQIIGSAIGDVFLAKASDQLRAGSLRNHTYSVLTMLAKTGIAPLVTIGLIAPSAFSVLFGDDWRRAGELVQWMTPWFILQFLASPISTVLHVVGRVKLAFVLQLSGLVIRLGSVFLANKLLHGFVGEAYAISGAIFYAIYLITILYIANQRNLEATK